MEKKDISSNVVLETKIILFFHVLFESLVILTQKCLVLKS